MVVLYVPMTVAFGVIKCPILVPFLREKKELLHKMSFIGAEILTCLLHTISYNI